MGEMARMRELAEAREALFRFLAEWETQVTGPDEDLKMFPLGLKTNAFIEAVAELAVKRVRADVREPSRVHAAPFDASDVHYLTEDLRDACGQVPSNVNVRMTARWENVTCRACRAVRKVNDRSSEAAEPAVKGRSE